MTRTESAPPAEASRSSTAAEVTGSHRPRRREVEAGDVEREREVDASEGLFHERESGRGEEKRLWGSEEEATAAAAVAVAVASSMAEWSEAARVCQFVGEEDEARRSWEEISRSFPLVLSKLVFETKRWCGTMVGRVLSFFLSGLRDTTFFYIFLFFKIYTSGKYYQKYTDLAISNGGCRDNCQFFLT